MSLRILRFLFCSAMFLPIVAGATTVRLETPLGNIDILLFEDDAPLTVANFLNYVNDGDYIDSFIHRSVPGFVIQGGGFTFIDDVVDTVPTDPPVVNEFNRSNLRGTIAMAKVAGDPDSANSQWFFNLADNSADLDTQNGGFTVFGEVIGDGMQVVDAIAALQVWNAGNPFTELPLIDFSGSGTIQRENLVMINAANVLQEVTQIEFNPGLNGSWFNPDTSGQGFFLEVFPNIPLIFLAWFTYDTTQPAPENSTTPENFGQQQPPAKTSMADAVVGDSNHRWITAQGPFDSPSATLDVTLTTGGLFDDPTDTTNSDPDSYGSITISFEDCNNGTVEYVLTTAGLSGTVPITRISGDNIPICEALLDDGSSP